MDIIFNYLAYIEQQASLFYKSPVFEEFSAEYLEISNCEKFRIPVQLFQVEVNNFK